VKPELEYEGMKLVEKEISEERRKIRKDTLMRLNTFSTSDCLQMLTERSFQDVRLELCDKVFNDKDICTKVFELLEQDPENDIFLDNAIRIFRRVYNLKDVGTDIIEFLKRNVIRDPKDFASMLQISGISASEDVARFCFTFYVFFKDNQFKYDDLFEGPLFGMLYSTWKLTQ
jgi:hypothetical protein